MARRKRRDADDVNERLDQETDEALDEAAGDDAALDDLDDDRDAIDDDLESSDDIEDLDDEADAEPAGRRGGTAVKRARADADAKATADTKSKTGKEKERPRRERAGLFGRLIRFIREVVAELRKVIWPTRKELITYTTVVIVFVAAMLAIIALLDFGFAKAMLWVFGGNTTEE